MKTIWNTAVEYDWAAGGYVLDAELPIGAEFLSVDGDAWQSDDGFQAIAAWWLVDPEAGKELRRLRAFPTGAELGSDVGRSQYLGTARTHENGWIVLHLFDFGTVPA